MEEIMDRKTPRSSWWSMRPALRGAALMFVVMLVMGGGGGDQSRLIGALHQAAAPARTEGEAAALTADLGGRMRVSGAFAEDAAHTSADVGLFAEAVRRDTATSTAADGDYHPLLVDSLGALRTESDGIALTTSEILATAADVQAVAATAGLRLMHASARRTAVGDTVFVLRHGTLATDPAFLYFDLTTDGAQTVTWPAGVNAANGIFLDRVSGTASVTYGTKTRSP